MLYLLFGLIIISVIGATIYAIVVPGDNENYKKCQHCNKSVKIETVVCKFCKKDLIELPYR